MSDQQTQMDKLVKILLKRGLKEDAELDDVLDMVNKELELKEEIKEEDPRVVLNSNSATIVWPSGLSMAFYLDGTTSCIYDHGVSEDGTEKLAVDDMPKTPKHIMDQVFKHICDLVRQMTSAVHKEHQSMFKEDKTRWIKFGNKRAFVAGMVYGQQHPKL